MTFWEELKRRRVVRVTIAYVVVAFGAVQAVGAFVPALHLPPETTTFVAVAALIGLPVTLLLTWMFQLTPSGIARDDGTSAPAPWPVKRTIAGIAIVGAAGVAAFVLMPHAKRLDAKRVLVAPFVDRTADPSLAAVGSMAADWITQGIIQATLADVVEPAALAGDASLRARATDPLADARANDAGTVITGSYYRQGDSLYISAKLTDVNTGRVITSLDAVTGRVAEPVEPVKTVRDRVLSALAASLGKDENGLILAMHLPTYPAYRAFADALKVSDIQLRSAGLAHAVAIDTTFDMARIVQVQAFAMQRDFTHSDSVIRVLDAKRDKLTRVELAFFERHRAFSNMDVPGTYVAAKRLAELMPGSRTAALEAMRMNRPREAIQEAEGVPEGVRQTRWGVYYGQVTAALHMLGDYRGEERTLVEAHKYHRDNWELVAADVRALAALGRIDEARTRLDESAALPRSVDGFESLRDCALELRAHGFAEDGKKVLDRISAELRTRPALPRRARAVYTDALYYAGHDADIIAMVDSARAAKTAPFIDPALLGMYGSIQAQRGNRAEATRVKNQLAGAVYDTMPDRFGRLVPRAWRARIAARLGDRDEALTILSDDVRVAPVANSILQVYAHIDPDLAMLVGWKPFDDLMKPKG